MNWKERYQRFKQWQKEPFDYSNHCKGKVTSANCGTVFESNFCPVCGQKAGTGPMNWRTVRQGVMQIWGMDSRSMGYSLLQLLLRPGYMISDYISGKRQVSFPPVKMLLIVAIGLMIVDRMWGDSTEISTNPHSAAFDSFFIWADSNPGWAMLTICGFLIIPTWILFRYAPKHHKHTLPEGFFTQVFMSVLMIIIGIVGAIVQGFWIFWLVPIYYVISYHQLFGYGWWGTLWRTALCIWTGLTLILIIEKATNSFINGLTDDLHTVAVMSVITLLTTVIGFWIGWKKNRLNTEGRF